METIFHSFHSHLYCLSILASFPKTVTELPERTHKMGPFFLQTVGVTAHPSLGCWISTVHLCPLFSARSYPRWWKMMMEDFTFSGTIRVKITWCIHFTQCSVNVEFKKKTTPEAVLSSKQILNSLAWVWLTETCPFSCLKSPEAQQQLEEPFGIRRWNHQGFRNPSYKASRHLERN